MKNITVNQYVNDYHVCFLSRQNIYYLENNSAFLCTEIPYYYIIRNYFTSLSRTTKKGLSMLNIMILLIYKHRTTYLICLITQQLIDILSALLLLKRKLFIIFHWKRIGNLFMVPYNEFLIKWNFICSVEHSSHDFI